MGIITSTFRKTENSETSGCSSWESVGSEYLAFMEKGGCIEPFLDYVDCKGEAEKKNEDAFTKCKKAKERLNKCVGAHREYHQPILKIMIPAVELVVNKIEALFPPEKLVDTVSTESADQPKEGDDPVYVFMNGGACTESYMALEDCIVKSTETNEDICKCTKAFTMLMKCMDAHSDYYQPILDAVYDGEDLYRTLLMSALRGDCKRI
ncbi:uncharacterized protein LOC106362273 [Brassica napus]|uniref:GCK domain-containing protein n=2 Tax=Brassica TaxID=3705 RepID=A0A8S9RRC5_BRACR|nr:uncharacterized protein LOC106362273 [Brassica napus]KAF3575379.1 hypothetical protein F2Q69_00061090 [Brassica cretica]CAF2109575.1 unnamed protein product [Brassica napus]